MANRSAIDMSLYFEGPAGQDGLIRVQSGHLVEPNGDRFRIWGVNLTGPDCLPPKELAPAIADDLARFGVNGVRFHQ
jgi:hypothetical protein